MMLEALKQDFAYALRSLRSRPGFAAAVVITMALGMGANAAMFGIIDRILFRGPDQVLDPDHVVILETHRSASPFANASFSYAAYADYRDHAEGFSSVAVSWTANSFPLGRGQDASRVAGALVSASFFPLLGVRPVLGRFFMADDDDERNPRNVAVIAYGFWQRRFGGNRGVIGQMLDIGADRYRVIGVGPQGFTGVDLRNVDLWLPITAAAGLRFDSSPTWTTNRGNTWLTVIARVKPGVSERLAEEQATAVHRAGLRRQIEAKPSVAKFIKPDSEFVALAPLVPGKAPPGVRSTVVASDDLKVSKLLGVVSIIVLVIACANVANLLLVRGFSRRREVAVRLALGVSARRLIGQLLVETLVLATLGGAGALIIAHWTSQSVRTLLLGQGAWTTEAIDARLLAFTALMTVTTALLTSLVPALAATRTDVAIALKTGAREGGGQRSLIREGLLVLQAALAIVLLVGAGLFLRSVENVNALPFGIDVNHVLVADINHKAVGLTSVEVHRLFERFESDVGALPGVRAVAVSIGLPFGLNWGSDIIVPGRAPSKDDNVAQFAVTPGYFSALGIPVLAGRAFDPGDRLDASPVVIISAKTASLYFPQQNAVGQCVKVGSDTMPCATIVGVVGNTIRQGIEDIVPQVYRPLDQLAESYIDPTVSFFGYELVARTTTDAARFVEPVRRTMQSAGPNVPYANVRPMRDLLGSRTRAWALGAKVFSVMGLLALVLAAVGLYSVLSFNIAERRHELSVRVALGAQWTNLVRITLGKGLLPIVGGIIVGLWLTLAAGRFVESLLFKVSPRDPSVLASVSILLLATAVIAGFLPVLRATRIDPGAVLRAD